MAALSEVSRLRLLRELMEGARTVSELIVATGMKQANVSKHLGILSAAGIVARQQEGNFARYSISDEAIEQLCSLVCRRVERDLDRRVRELQGL